MKNLLKISLVFLILTLRVLEKEGNRIRIFKNNHIFNSLINSLYHRFSLSQCMSMVIIYPNKMDSTEVKALILEQ